MSGQSEPKIAMLSADDVQKIRRLEEELGVLVVAYEKPLRPATLTDEQIVKLQALEREIGDVYLVAYEK